MRMVSSANMMQVDSNTPPRRVGWYSMRVMCMGGEDVTGPPPQCQICECVAVRLFVDLGLAADDGVLTACELAVGLKQLVGFICKYFI